MAKIRPTMTLSPSLHATLLASSTTGSVRRWNLARRNGRKPSMISTDTPWSSYSRYLRSVFVRIPSVCTLRTDGGLSIHPSVELGRCYSMQSIFA
ncbi:hypothetical protein F5146DRAFT_1123114 [Armillaria mellea]|nr:hypothetical protein F5146DRAFT_1123114 [Armillaria mellea]